MIYGIGVDLIEIERIKKAVHKNDRFAQRILTDEEFSCYQNLRGQRQMEFLAGRFSAKEAFSKAMGTGIGQTVSFHSLTILNNEKGQAQVIESPFSGRVHLSISHTQFYAVAQIVLEQTEA